MILYGNESSFLSDISELHIVVNQLSSSINHVVLQLIRQLKRRDKLRNRMEKNCDIITAYLQAISPKRSQDTRLRFSIDPPRNDTGYTQWHDAMRMVARLQEGIPQDFRRRLWLSLANNYVDSRQIKWYDVERKCFSGTINTTDEELGQQILKDLHRTGCSLFCGDYAEENQAVLKRVLLAFARWNKRVGYCQGFNMLAAIILGVMLGNESDSLKVMVFLVEGVLPDGYFGENLRGLSIDMAVFRELLRLRLPELSAHLDMLQQDGADTQGTTYEPPLTNVFTMQWFLTLFSTCLPKDSVLRIWDLIFLEGNEVLLRTALALWDSLVDRILAVQSADEFYCIMGVLAREMAEFSSSDTNDLLKTIVEVAPFPFPGLHELREKYTYSLTPWSQSVVSVAKKGLRLIYSDDDDSDSEIKEMTVATAFGLGNMKSPRSRRNSCARSQSSSPASSEDRRNLDVISLTKQYKKLRERQKQAQILWNDTTRKIKDGAQKIAPTSVNQLIITEVNPRSKIAEIETKPDGPLIMRTHFSSVRLQPQEKSKISEKRQHEKGKNISFRRSFSNENSSSSGSTELCDDDDVPRLSDLDSPSKSPAKSPSLQHTSRRVDDVMKENLEILNRLRRSNSSDSDTKYFSPFPIDRNQQKLNYIRSSMERK
ncbi:TBC1 domain family member 30-like [Artemia franciscana]|uniref:TBC1 domain family member 30-like n=1 Tax=Artemia franciscana TaxID=6661 RepID=UPI0032DADB2C